MANTARTIHKFTGGGFETIWKEPIFQTLFHWHREKNLGLKAESGFQAEWRNGGRRFDRLSLNF
jgi:hypothetical protein